MNKLELKQMIQEELNEMIDPVSLFFGASTILGTTYIITLVKKLYDHMKANQTKANKKLSNEEKTRLTNYYNKTKDIHGIISALTKANIRRQDVAYMLKVMDVIK